MTGANNQSYMRVIHKIGAEVGGSRQEIKILYDRVAVVSCCLGRVSPTQCLSGFRPLAAA